MFVCVLGQLAKSREVENNNKNSYLHRKVGKEKKEFWKTVLYF